MGNYKKSRGHYLKWFLGNFSKADHGVDRATYHHYFSKVDTESDLTTPPTLDSLKAVLAAAQAAYAPYQRGRNGSSQLWLGETGLELNSKIGPSHGGVGPTHLDCGNHQVGIDCPS